MHTNHDGRRNTIIFPLSGNDARNHPSGKSEPTKRTSRLLLMLMVPLTIISIYALSLTAV